MDHALMPFDQFGERFRIAPLALMDPLRVIVRPGHLVSIYPIRQPKTMIPLKIFVISALFAHCQRGHCPAARPGVTAAYKG